MIQTTQPFLQNTQKIMNMRKVTKYLLNIRLATADFYFLDDLKEIFPKKIKKTAATILNIYSFFNPSYKAISNLLVTGSVALAIVKLV